MKNMTGFTIFISIFFIIGFAVLGSGIYTLIKSTQSKDWPTVPAFISKCDFHESSDDDGTSYRVSVRYDYEVQGTAYSGKRIAFGYAGSSNERKQREIYSKLKNSAQIEVKYNASNPAESTIVSGMDKPGLFIIIFGLTWLLFCTGFTYLSVVSQRTEGKNSLIENIRVIQTHKSDHW